MAIVNEGLKKELVHVTRPNELKHISDLFAKADPLMQDISYALIIGNQHDVDRLTKQALEGGYAANQATRLGLWSSSGGTRANGQEGKFSKNPKVIG